MTSGSNWNKPLSWERGHADFFAEHGRRQRVFCASLADVFDNAVDPKWRADLFRLIVMTPNLDWLLLTKRIGNVRDMLAGIAHGSDPDLTLLDMMPLPNVWIGATVVNQEEADRDIPKLLAVPAAKRFLSIEPMLGQVDLRLPIRTWANSRGDLACDHCCNGDRCDDPAHFARGHPDWAPHCRCPHCRGTGKGKPIDWVIVGGESGPGARPMHPDWARSLRDQCEDAGVPFLFKQWGEWEPINQMPPGKCDALYASKVKANPDQDRYVLDDIYGKSCIAQYTVVHPDGSTHDVLEPGAWIEGAMQTFKVGKKSAGRLLDGRTWHEVPA